MRSSLAIIALTLLALAAPSIADAPAALKTTEFGKGPALVLLPGLGSQRLQWMPTAKKMLGNYHVVMTDLPGHGDSPMPNPFSLEAAAAALDPVLAKFNPESTVVVAHGVGGLIAVLEARAHPERMRGLVVIDAGLRSPLPIADQQKSRFVEFVEQNYDQVLRMMFTAMGRDSAQGVELHAKASLIPSANVKSYLRQLLDADGSGAARALKVPVLYLASSRSWDEAGGWAALAKMRGWENVPNLRTRRVGDSGYLMMSDQPDSLAAILDGFAREVIAGKSLSAAD